MRISKIKHLLAAAFVCLLLSACTFGAEPNDIAYITALGIDKAETDGDYYVTIQFAKPSMISGGASEEGGKGEDLIEHLTVEAPTVYSAVSLANKIISKTFSTEHLSLIVISEEIGSEDAGDLIKTITGDKDIRPETFLAVAQESAREFFENVEPVIEINPVRYYRMILSGDSTKSFTNTDIHTFYLNMISGCRDTVVPAAGIMEESSEGESGGSESGGSESGGSDTKANGGSGGDGGKNQKQSEAQVNTDPFEWGIRDYAAGEIAISNSNKSELAGGAVFSGGRLMGYIGTTEVKALSLMTGSEYTLSTINTFGVPVSLYIKKSRPMRVSADASGETPVINVSLAFKGAMTYTPEYFAGGKNVAEFEEAAGEALRERILSTLITLRDMDSDAVGFGKYAMARFTREEFERYNWKEKYKSAQINVDVSFKLEHMGV